MNQIWSNVRTEVSSQDIEIMLENWQYVEIIADRIDGQKESLKAPTDGEKEPHFLMSFDSDWQIQYWVGSEDFASIMSCSAGSALYGGLDFMSSSSLGTDKAHAAKAAISMVHYASLQSWPGITITEGSDFMRWVVWAAATSYNLPIQGFDPNKDDLDKKDRCMYLLQTFLPQKNFVQGSSLSFGSADYHDADDPE